MNDPGLNVQTLQGLRTARDTSLIFQRIRVHLDNHEGYVAFSGGKDSLVVLDLVRRVDPQVPVVFFDSGLEFPETYNFLEQTVVNWKLNFHVVPARIPALEILAAHGGWDHQRSVSAAPDLHQILITEPAAQAHQQHGPGELWGVRAQESRGRASMFSKALHSAPATAETPIKQQHRALQGGQVFRVDQTVSYSPVWDWRSHEIWGWISRNQLPVNPIYEKLRRLGATDENLRVALLVDANQIESGRITWLRRGWPSLFDELSRVLPRLREYV